VILTSAMHKGFPANRPCATPAEGRRERECQAVSPLQMRDRYNQEGTMALVVST